MITNAFETRISLGLVMLKALRVSYKAGSRGFSLRIRVAIKTLDPSSLVNVKLKNWGDTLTVGSSFSAQIPFENMNGRGF